MKYSIIIPAYNVERYISQCLLSVIHCKGEYEVIVVNDGSDDQTLEICQSIQETYPHMIIIDQKNAGVSAARNAGIKKSLGQYIVFLDADDYWIEDAIQVFDRNINGNISPDVLFTIREIRQYNGRGTRAHDILPLQYADKLLKTQDLLSLTLHGTCENLFSAWRGVFRSDLILREGLLFDEAISIGEDADWLFRFLSRSETCRINVEPYYVYRVNREGSAISIPTYRGVSSFITVVEKWVCNQNSIPVSLKFMISSKLSNNLFDYMRYFWGFDKEERIDCLTRSNNIFALGFVSKRKMWLIKIASSLVPNMYLALLYYSWRIRQRLKNIFSTAYRWLGHPKI